jgi:hypothetical protein
MCRRCKTGLPSGAHMRSLGYMLLIFGFAGTLYHSLATRKTKGAIMAKHVQQLQIGQSYGSEDVIRSVRGAIDDVAWDSNWYLSCAGGMLLGGILVGLGSSHRKVSNEQT